MNVLVLLCYAIHLSITNTSNYHYPIQHSLDQSIFLSTLMSLFLNSLVFSIILPAGIILLQNGFNYGYPIQFSHHRLRVNIVVSEQKSRPESIIFTIYCALP